MNEQHIQVAFFSNIQEKKSVKRMQHRLDLDLSRVREREKKRLNENEIKSIYR